MLLARRRLAWLSVSPGDAGSKRLVAERVDPDSRSIERLDALRAEAVHLARGRAA